MSLLIEVFFLFPGCPLKIHIYTFHFHEDLVPCNLSLQGLLFCQLLVKKHNSGTKSTSFLIKYHLLEPKMVASVLLKIYQSIFLM